MNPKKDTPKNLETLIQEGQEEAISGTHSTFGKLACFSEEMLTAFATKVHAAGEESGREKAVEIVNDIIRNSNEHSANEWFQALRCARASIEAPRTNK